MLGPILIIVVLVAMVPMFLVGGGVLMAFCGWLFTKDAEARHEGSELLDTNI